MVAKSVKWVLAGLLVSPTAALALGLGDIHLLSTLNAPLDADIDLIGATPDELASLTPKIAPREVFAQHGLDWPAFLSNVTVHAVHTSDGRDVLELRSTEPVTEPFLTLLVELDWDRGHFVRQYTILFDPPVYTPGAGRVAQQAIEAPRSGATAHEGTIRRSTAGTGASAAGGAGSAVGAAGSSAASAAGASAGPAAAAGETSGASAPHSDTYLVRRGDTLSGIAAKLGGGSGVEEKRWMVAAFQGNHDAFDHNMNLLRSGAVLRIPSESAIAAVSADDASAEVHRQYVAWRGAGHEAATGEQPGRLRLVAPGQASAAAGAAGVGAATGGNVKALQGEVQSLQAQLAESRRLLDMRNAELAQLQAKLGARESGGAAASVAPGSSAAASPTGPNASSPTAAETAAGASGASATAATSASSATPTTASEAASATSAQQTVAATAPPAAAAKASASSPPRAARKPVRRPAASSHAAPESPSWVDTLGPLGWALAALVAVLLGFLGFRAWNSRRKAGFDDSLGRLAEAGATSSGIGSAASAHEPAFPETAPQMAPKRESSFLVEESGTHERPRFDEPDAAPAARHVEADDTISSETAINLDQGDPLAEADFHMAYGLYDQAADLIRIAIQREPARRDLKLKLLEVFFVWGNKEQFLATARELAETRAAAAPGEWEKIVIMGKQLAPDDPLFAGGAAVSGAAAGGVDLDLEGGAADGGRDGVDFDIIGDPVATSGEDGVDLDIGTAIGDRDPAAEAAAQRATDRNLALDESAVLPEDSTVERETATATRQMLNADSATGSTREMTARTRELAGATREMTATLDGTPLSHEVTWDSEEGTPEGPTVEQPALSTPENPTIRQKVQMALRAGAGEHTTELALDDLGLDLTALAPAPDAREQLAEEAQPDAPTLVAGLDQHSRELMESAERRASGGDSELKVSETGTWHFDDDPFARGDATGQLSALGADPSATSRLAALDGGSLDFEVGEPHQAAARANGAGGGVDLDVGTATVSDVAFTATTKLSADDLALPDLDPVTMSEVGTKLDLARAYMDMGDPEGARNILEEVLTEGSAAQKQEAERLIASLPG